MLCALRTALGALGTVGRFAERCFVIETQRNEIGGLQQHFKVSPESLRPHVLHTFLSCLRTPIMLQRLLLLMIFVWWGGEPRTGFPTRTILHGVWVSQGVTHLNT